MEAQVACIVEGHGEVEAVPILIHRIAERLEVGIRVLPPLRVPKGKLLRAGELERAVELQARKLAGAGGIAIVIDADDDCPAELGPLLLERAARARSDMSVAVVLAKRKFEAWFLAAAESLAGHRGLAADLRAPPDPEAIRGAKEWLSARMQGASAYSETLDQPALAAVLNLDRARRAASFDKFFRELVRLLSTTP